MVIPARATSRRMIFQVRFNSAFGRHTQGHKALFVPFPGNTDKARFKFQIRYYKIGEFGDAKPTPVEKLDHSNVAQSTLLYWVYLLNDKIDLPR